ncbi:efflux RND transporter permease subunit [Clostridium sp. AM58-1XD]|uniref:efflux RND transporter permease subunit n=1 Tax=Clostridium sp. AM58-1XD TaxID=2292307 RepID=UPI000E545BAF|nr:efflux RND transporter permease subunit [Clostridium sp. AM58-1XD]RGY96954.1 AcrB/AcrD/AcrF family protein [Clostridium sp. AM58-1XD]
MGITRFVLKRPVTAVLSILCLIVFGYTAISSSTLELTPEMSMPMMVVIARYDGANPEDVCELVTKEIEDSVSTLSGLKSMSSTSSDGSSMVMLEYEYGTDMDEAYDDLKKKVDSLERSLPDDVDTPTVMEMDMNASEVMTLSITNPEEENIYDYVENTIVPELEKISSIAEVSSRGGSKEYIKVEMMPEKMSQYGVTMASIASDIAASDVAYPAGDTDVGSQELSVTTSLKASTQESLKTIPLTTTKSSKNIVYLQDVANIYTAKEEASSISRYNGEETMSVSISKQQSASAMEVSKAVNKNIQSMMAANKGLDIVVASDTSEDIMDSLKDVIETLIMAIIISMVILWLFFGDLKASLIVGSSIPVSILVALILMNRMGFSLNVITMSALTLGVGMMVDNSIVVLESCFRATDKVGMLNYAKAALEGTGIVGASVLGSTLTTCVVFLPLAFLQGMTGQLFKPLGFTIVFCMAASLLSAVAVVPLCYMLYRPRENEKAPMFHPVKRMQDGYRRIMKVLLPKKKTVMFTSLILLVGAYMLSKHVGTELMASDDQGQINITIETRPGLKTAKVDELLKQAEAIVATHEDLDSYMSRAGGGGSRGSSSATINAYLKDDRKMSTDDVADQWRKELASIENCDISVEAGASMSMMSSRFQSYEVLLQSADYDTLKETSSNIVKMLSERPELTKVHSSLENGAPIVKIQVDAIKAKAAGLTASGIGSTVNQMLSGKEATTLEIDGDDVDVRVEYADGKYTSIDQIRNIILTTPEGGAVALTDVADINFEDSPSTLRRNDKEYRVTIEAEYTEQATSSTKQQLTSEVISRICLIMFRLQETPRDQSQAEEFSALFKAIALAVFLIFVVMAAQFESPKFSIMVMTTIPFSLIGSVFLLWLTNCKISMTSLIGFLMLIGTVVNNGILYVDTVNQYRAEMDMETALIEAGATRLRPILMTTLTTIVAMIPMALAIGSSGSMTQGLAVVNIGGLIASTVLALLMLPVYYSIMNRKPKKEAEMVDC